MYYTVYITPIALIELEDIAYFISLDNEEIAIRFIKELKNHFITNLSMLPELWESYNSNTRKITYKGYTAFYRFKKQKKMIEILHISNLKKPMIIK